VRIQSEHVARVLRRGELTTAHLHVMSSERRDLADELDQPGQVLPSKCDRLLAASFRAVAEAHIARAHSRDLKPANLF